MIINKDSKVIKVLAIVLLALLIVSMVVPIAVSALSGLNNKVSQEQPSTEVATTVFIEEPINTEPKVTLIDTPVLFSDLHYITWYDIDLSNEHINTVRKAVTEVETAINSNEYTHEAIQQMQQEVTRLCSIISFTEADVRHYTEWETDHYYAAKTWQFLKNNGYTDAVASGIIGNMMIETSGGTLNLKPTVYNSTGGFYGLCQWSVYYYPEAADMPFENQLEYLNRTMEKEFKNFGFCYKYGFTYEDFLAMEDPEQAALAFAKIYERCGSGSYGARQRAARTAYNYFVLGA